MAREDRKARQAGGSDADAERGPEAVGHTKEWAKKYREHLRKRKAPTDD